MTQTTQQTRVKATYQGVVIGWYNTTADAEAAIERAERIEMAARDAEDVAPWDR